MAKFVLRCFVMYIYVCEEEQATEDLDERCSVDLKPIAPSQQLDIQMHCLEQRNAAYEISQSIRNVIICDSG
jgi:hypothetical protein